MRRAARDELRIDLFRGAAAEVARPDPLRRAHHHRRLPADLHARGARGEDVPADGDHGVLGPARLAAAVAHRRAGGLVLPAEARRAAPRGAVVRPAARALPAPPRRRDEPPGRTIGVALAVVVVGARLGAVPRHRVHAEARRGLDPRRDAQAAVGVARRSRCEISTRVERDRRGVSRRCSRWSPSSAGRTWRPRRWASTRATSTCCCTRWTSGTSGRTKEDAHRRDGRGARRTCPGVAFNFTQPMAMRLDEVVSGVKADVAVKVFGPDAARARAARRAGAAASRRTCRARPTCRWRCSPAAPQIEIDDRPRRHRALRPERAPTCRRSSRPRSAGGRPPSCSTARGASPSCCGCPPTCADDAGRHLARSCVTAPGGERVPLGRLARIRGRRDAGGDQPRERASGASWCRATCAAATSAASSPRRSSGWPDGGRAADRLLPHVGRPVREPAAGHRAG